MSNSDPSPYSPPRGTNELRLPESMAVGDTICFVINFAVSTFLFIVSVFSILSAENAFAFLGGLFIVLPAGCYAVAEWVCWYRQRLRLLLPLGIINLMLAAFLGFGLIVNIGEALLAKEQMGSLYIFIFGVIWSSVNGYVAWCGWRRVFICRRQDKANDSTAL